MVIFSVYEDMFSDLYKWLMETYKQDLDMEGFSEREGEPYFSIDFGEKEIAFNRDNYTLPFNRRCQILTKNATLGFKIDTGLITIITDERKVYSKRLELYKL